ncbi:MAG: glycosyltransferase [Acidocella sp.]|nr:glycosyltransferase [Acidocella sp.]
MPMSPNHPLAIIIDMRCLQDRNYTERGIGNHARNIIAHVEAPFTGIIDPALPSLPAAWAARAASLSPHGYIPDAPPGTVFLNPSPMSPDQNFIARILTQPNILKAALVYDFIPLDHPADYLTHPVTRLDYYAALAWARRYDILFPISQDTDARLRALYSPRRTHITGVALPSWIAGIAPAMPRHILMIGGEDARKNPETLLRAIAASDILKSVKCIITGAQSAPRRAQLRAIADVELPGRLDEAAMRSAYEGALCVVVPSRAEGFSLPVIEAMAAQAPAIVSDIPAHRALIPDPAHRFAPDDIPALTAILERLVTQPETCREIAAAQGAMLDNFTPKAVAAKIWTRLVPATPGILRRVKPRIALLSPLPPARSGVADYSAACAAALGAQAVVSLFSGDTVSAFPFLAGRYDRVITAIGNSPLHQRIYDLTLRHGAAVICHDARLLGLVSARGLGHAAAQGTAELGRVVREDEISAWAADERMREACFLGPLASAARPLIFHSRASVAQVKTRFGVTARHLPFAVYHPFPGAITQAMRAEARQALGLPPNIPHIASFGFIGGQKGIGHLLRALALLRKDFRCRLLLIGAATDETAPLRALADEFGVTDDVIWGTGFMPEAKYRQYLLAANAGVQLREGGPGNISGALQDCIAAGLPGIANQDLAENLEAPAFITRVSDRLDAGEIAGALQKILDIGHDTEPARAQYHVTHGMAAYARGLMACVGLGSAGV